MNDDTEKKDESPACGCNGRASCCSGPGKWIWIVLILAIAGVLIAKNAGKKKASASAPEQAAVSSIAPVDATGTKQALAEPAGRGQALPRLVDLGAGKCIPCKMMAPIIEELKHEYAGAFEVQFIDVWKDPEQGHKHGINLIPTQIFYDAAGKELFRHEGFMSKEDILAKWKELGIDIAAAPVK